MFERVDSTIKAIRRQLLEDESIRKLLFHNSNNALQLSAPDKKDVEKYITTCPIYSFEGKDDYTQQGMINLFMSDSNPDGEQVGINGVIRCNVVYNTDKWTLVDGSCRLLKIIDRIIALTDKRKFSISNAVEYVNAQELILSKQLVGYALLFEIYDGDSNLQNF